MPCTRGSTAPARSRVLSTPSRSGVCPGAGRGCIAAHRALSSIIHLHALPASQRRAHYTRASFTAVSFIGRSRKTLPTPREDRACGAGLSDRIDGRRCTSSLVRDSTTPTDRPAIFSPPSVHLIYTAQGTGAHLHPLLLPDFSLPISSHPAVRCRTWIMRRCAFEATRGRGGALALRRGLAGSGSFWGSLPPYQYSHGVLARPPDPSIPHLDRTARCSRCFRAAARRRARGGLGLRDAASGVPSMRDLTI
ncbi:hypothetical protein B0H14DRAFT_3510087 [Mycena olivaceomarginata]|nr:hypothetical protein B0H14DRAFT_3510087 [Mycena olivaceomarginata]